MIRQTLSLIALATLFSTAVLGSEQAASVASNPPAALGSGTGPERDTFLSNISPAAALSGFEEQFSPYSGQFLARFLTASLPGKGGLDLNVFFYYSSEVWNRTDQFEIHSASIDTTDHLGGGGWQLHMGKVINPAGIGSPNVVTPDNPLVVMPDGSTRLLYGSSEFPGEMISEDRWRFRFDQAIPGWELTATDGTVYLLQTINDAGANSMSGTPIAQCTRITDVNGNTITVSYTANTGQNLLGLIDEIVDTWGRRVEFTYYTNTDRIQFLRVKNGTTTLQEWEFRYTTKLLTWTHLFGDRDIYAVDEVIPPQGDRWTFTTNSAAIPKDNGAAMLDKIVLPTGGTLEYTYDGVDFEVGCDNGISIQRAALKGRDVGGRGVVPATYTYSYLAPGEDTAKTTISGPLGYSEVYDLIGFGSYQHPDPNLFKIGRVESKTVTDDVQTVQETITWTEGDTLSNHWRLSSPWGGCINSRGLSPVKFVKPSSITRTITRDGTQRSTTTSNFDQYGNPQTITESGEVLRTTNLDYWYSTSLNILEGRLTLEEKSPGGRERRFYDTLGRLDRLNIHPTSATATNGVDTTFAYDTSGRVTETRTENGNGIHDDRITRFESYSFGKPERDEYENNSADVNVNRDINALGLVAWEENGREGSSFRTHYQYDDYGRVTLIDPPLGDSTVIVYAADGSTITVTRGTGSGAYRQQYSFDGFARLTKWEDLERLDRREIIYDQLERKEEERLFRGGITSDKHFFDGAGRLTRIERPGGSAIQYSYLSSNRVTITDERGKATQFTYESFGDPDERRLKKLVDADNKIWNYSYDSSKGLLSLIDAPVTGADRDFTYTTRFELDLEDHPEITGNGINYDYSPANDLTSRFKGGITVFYEFDQIGRLDRIDPGGTSYDVTFGYLGLDLPNLVSNAAASHTRAYDNAGRLSSRTSTLGPLSPKTTSYLYDGHDRVTRVTYPSGRVVDYDFNFDGELIGVDSPTGVDYVTLIRYTTAGDVDDITYGNGILTDYTYDTRFRPINIDGGGDSIGLAYDGASNVTTWTSGGVTRSFTYDNLGRLETATGPAGETIVYDYTATGNRDFRTIDGVTETYSYGSERLTSISGGPNPMSFGYDNGGRMTSAGALSFSYTPLDELETVTNPALSFTYDGENYRVSRTSSEGTVYFLRDSAGRVLAEYDGAGALLREHIYALGRRMVSVEVDGSRFYIQHDAQGSAWRVTDDTGEVTEQHQYWPFGSTADPTSSLGSTGTAARGGGSEGSSEGNRWTGNSLSTIFSDDFSGRCHVAWTTMKPHVCGNALVVAPEECESACPLETTCAELGFTGGTLGCQVFTCSFDTSGCYTCGNQIVEPPEVCDGNNHDGETCESLGFDDGVLACSGNCLSFDTSMCFNFPPADSERPRFTGKELDPDIGLYYFDTRYLNPALGRFTVPDLAALEIDNPQSFNRYAYVLNNPYRFNDPDGRSAKAVHAFHTRSVLASFGFKSSDIDVVVKANLSSDKWPRRIFTPQHATTLFQDGAFGNAQGGRYAEAQLEKAIQLKGQGKNQAALRALGRALHAAEDQIAHRGLGNVSHTVLQDAWRRLWTLDFTSGPKGERMIEHHDRDNSLQAGPAQNSTLMGSYALVENARIHQEILRVLSGLVDRFNNSPGF